MNVSGKPKTQKGGDKSKKEKPKKEKSKEKRKKPKTKKEKSKKEVKVEAKQEPPPAPPPVAAPQPTSGQNGHPAESKKPAPSVCTNPSHNLLVLDFTSVRMHNIFFAIYLFKNNMEIYIHPLISGWRRR